MEGPLRAGWQNAVDSLTNGETRAGNHHLIGVVRAVGISSLGHGCVVMNTNHIRHGITSPHANSFAFETKCDLYMRLGLGVSIVLGCLRQTLWIFKEE
jgi:hypothetical protein